MALMSNSPRTDMKDQATPPLNSLSQTGSIYTHFMMHHMQHMTELFVNENGKMIEQAKSKFQAISQAKTPAEVLQLASEHMQASANEAVAFNSKVYALIHQEQSDLLAAIQKQWAESGSTWQAALDKVPSGGSVAGTDFMLNAFKAALEMGQRTLETTQSASQKTSELLNGAMNGSDKLQAAHRETRSNHKALRA
jgi:hypothetical protein